MIDLSARLASLAGLALCLEPPGVASARFFKDKCRPAFARSGQGGPMIVDHAVVLHAMRGQ